MRSGNTFSSGSCAINEPNGATTRRRSRHSSFSVTCQPGSPFTAMEPLLVHPDPPPPELAQALDLGGYPWKGVAAEADIAGAEPDDGWSGAIVLVDRDPDTAF